MCRDAKGLATVKEEDSECNGTLLDPKNNTRVFHLQDSFSSQDGLRLNYSHSVNADKKWSLMPDRSASNSFETPKPKSLLDNYLKLGHKDH